MRFRPLSHNWIPPTPHQSRLQPDQGQLKEMIPAGHKIYERFIPVCLPVYREHWLPSLVVWPIYWVSWSSSSQTDPSTVTGANWEPNTRCIQLKPWGFDSLLPHRYGNLGRRHKGRDFKDEFVTDWTTKTQTDVCANVSLCWPSAVRSSKTLKLSFSCIFKKRKKKKTLETTLASLE